MPRGIYKHKPISEEHKKKISESSKAMWKEMKNNAAKYKRWRRKMSRSLKGRTFTKEWKKKLSLAHKNQAPWNKGMPKPEETKCKIRLALKGRHTSPRTEFTSENISGKNHPLWKGGISFEPYSPEFNRKLKMKIRARDGHVCQFPKCGLEENGKAHHIHHIDYNKKNNHPDNLITLCNRHNASVNMNRKYWRRYFTDIVIKTME